MKTKHLLLAFLFISLHASAQLPGNVPTNGLVGFWPFNGNANDESGNGTNMSLTGAALTSDRKSISNKAYFFNGTSDYMVDETPSFLFGEDSIFTINTWTNFSTLNGKGEIATSLNLNSGNFVWVLDYYDGYLRFGAANQQGKWHLAYYSINNLQTNQWYNISAEYNNGVIKLYLNNDLVSTQSYTKSGAKTSLLPFSFGAIHHSSTNKFNYYNGKIDDIGIWNRALTQQEITDLYMGCQLSINTQPINQTINFNNNARFIVSCSDANTSYQWQTDKGTGFKNISNAGQYSGASNDTLTVMNVNMSNNNQKFRCVLSYGSCKDTTDIAILTVCGSLTVEPLNKTPKLNSSTHFNAASSDANASYQWQSDMGFGFQNLSNAGQYSGTTNDTLTIKNVSMSNTNQKFRCVHSSGSCTDTTGIAILTVCGLLTTQPVNASVKFLETTQFTANSSDANATYQWQTDMGIGFKNISDTGQYIGSTNNTLIIKNVNMSNTNQKFRCVLISGSCTDTTWIAILTVCGSLTTQPINTSVKFSETTYFTTNSSDANATYQWQTDMGTGFKNISDAGQYSGSIKNTLIIKNVNMSNTNQKFRCVLISGSCTDTTGIAILTVCGSLSAQPVNSSVKFSETAQFNANSSDANATYQWQSDIGFGFQNLSNAGQYIGTGTKTLTVANVSFGNQNQKFRMISLSGTCLDTSAIAVLTVFDNSGVEENELKPGIAIYPNPTYSHITISVNQRLVGASFTLYNPVGKMVYSGKLSSENTHVDLSSLASGIYFLSLNEEKRILHRIQKF